MLGVAWLGRSWWVTRPGWDTLFLPITPHASLNSVSYLTEFRDRAVHEEGHGRETLHAEDHSSRRIGVAPAPLVASRTISSSLDGTSPIPGFP